MKLHGILSFWQKDSILLPIGKSISPNAWTARRVAERSTVRFISWPQEVGCECGACENLNVLIIAS
ncbi:hypothetical protein ACC817_10010, partial [Rhizobium ruizarguesonis]